MFLRVNVHLNMKINGTFFIIMNDQRRNHESEHLGDFYEIHRRMTEMAELLRLKNHDPSCTY